MHISYRHAESVIANTNGYLVIIYTDKTLDFRMSRETATCNAKKIAEHTHVLSTVLSVVRGAGLCSTEKKKKAHLVSPATKYASMPISFRQCSYLPLSLSFVPSLFPSISLAALPLSPRYLPCGASCFPSRSKSWGLPACSNPEIGSENVKENPR